MAEDEPVQSAAAAEARAEALLLEQLDDTQREAFRTTGTFVVRGRRANYRIGQEATGNIEMLTRRGRVKDRLCVVPRESLPLADAMLAQKLMAETDEDRLLRIAGRLPRSTLSLLMILLPVLALLVTLLVLVRMPMQHWNPF